ncbi:MAG: flagellar hook-associated protein FlgL [Bacillota bacterium]
MRVTHRMLAHAVNRNLKHNMHALNRRSNQLSSGRIFDRPSQDPVGTYKVMRIAGTGLARNAQYCRNIGEGISWLSATEDALAGAIDTVQRLREISVYAANEIFTAADRLAVAPEVKQLLDYLISIGNTELAGRYIFGGHQTDQKPYGIAGDGGKMINTWHNPASGLFAGTGGGTGLTVENLSAGNYAVSTAREQLAHIGDPAENITAMELETRDFLEGEYRITTDPATAPADAGTSYFQYSQSSEEIIKSVAVAAGTDKNMSLLLSVSEINIGTNKVTFQYEYTHMEKDGTSSTGTGSLILDAGLQNNFTIAGVVFNQDGNGVLLADIGTFNVGDKAVINIKAQAAPGDNDDGVIFYRDGVTISSYVFNDGALNDNDATFNFYQLDTDPLSFTYGEHLLSEVKLTFAGTGLIETTMDNPAALFTIGPSVSIISEYLQGARAGFFGTDKINIARDSNDGLTGSVALEIVESVRYQDLSDALQGQIGGKINDRVVRLTARYLMKSVDGLENYEGAYGLRDGEDIYINLNKLHEFNQQITFMVDGKNVALNIKGLEALTFEHDVPLVGDKIVLQLKPMLPMSTAADYDRFTLHRDYGRPDASGRPTTGDSLDWYFERGVFDPDPPAGAKTTMLKFFDIDQISGNIFTSTVKATFSNFGTAAAREHRDREEIVRYGIPDEEYDEYPATIFSFIAAGEPYFTGNSGERLLEIAPGIAVPANISGLHVFDLKSKDGVGLFRAVNGLYKALIYNNQVALGGPVLHDLDIYLNSLLKHRSELGARMERSLVTEERHQSEHLFLRELRSKIEDIDMADIITEFTLQETIYQAALATGARMIYPSLIDFLR